MTRCHCIPVLSAQALPCRLDGYPRILRYWVSTSPIMGYKVVDLTAHTRLLSKDALLVVLIRTVYTQTGLRLRGSIICSCAVI